ncbi:MAG: GGDEF domain-containing protein, partial [Betaproteobacteria bacterium]|nr:GGDEF domain-containing protein [Betaproteobacteria bacterium]
MTEASRISSRAFRQMALLLVGLTLCMLVAGSTFVYYSSTKLFEERMTATARSLGEGLSLAVADSLLVKDFGTLESRLIQALSGSGLLSVTAVDLEGRVLSSVERSPQGTPMANYSLSRIALPDAAEPRVKWLEKGGVVAWQPVALGRTVGWLRLELTDETQAAFGSLGVQALAIAIAFSAVLLGAFAFVLSRAYRVIDTNEVHLHRENSALSERAQQDPLTGLPNRAGLTQLLAASMARADASSSASLAVCFIDLDGFKPINDAHGHDVGDKVLQSVAGRIRAIARQGDYLARLGGDEFVLVVHGLENIWEMEPVLSRLMHTMNTPLSVGPLTLRLGLSAGVALYPQ